MVFGKAGGFGSNIELSSLHASAGFRIDGANSLDNSGCWVDGAGDVNGDGFGDVMVGAIYADYTANNSGTTYVVFGKASGLGSAIQLSDLDGSSGFLINGEASGDWSGFSVSGTGDVNGDGSDDMIIGAWRHDSHGTLSGASYVVFGNTSGFASSMDLSALDGMNGFKLSGAAPVDEAGFTVDGAGDINHDGYADVIVGADYADPNGGQSGAAYVVFGKASGFSSNIELSALNGHNGFRISGEAAADYAGYSVAAAGDVNGDGFDDVVVGAVYADSKAGASSVVFGKASGFSSNLELSALNGHNGFKIDGITAAGQNGSVYGDQSGFSVAGAGDFNGDGFADVIIGAAFAGPNGTYSGAAYVVFGKAGGFASEIQLSDLDGGNGFQINGAAAHDYAGKCVSAAGDINGDGFDDIIVGAPRCQHPRPVQRRRLCHLRLTAGRGGDAHRDRNRQPHQRRQLQGPAVGAWRQRHADRLGGRGQAEWRCRSR